MKQVNFKELSVEIEIDKFQNIDLRKEIGNAIHRQAVTVPMSELARKIYYSEGDVSMTDEDYSMMISVVSKSFALIVTKAVERSTIDKDKEV